MVDIECFKLYRNCKNSKIKWQQSISANLHLMFWMHTIGLGYQCCLVTVERQGDNVLCCLHWREGGGVSVRNILLTMIPESGWSCELVRNLLTIIIFCWKLSRLSCDLETSSSSVVLLLQRLILRRISTSYVKMFNSMILGRLTEN